MTFGVVGGATDPLGGGGAGDLWVVGGATDPLGGGWAIDLYIMFWCIHLQV